MDSSVLKMSGLSLDLEENNQEQQPNQHEKATASKRDNKKLTFLRLQTIKSSFFQAE